MTYFISGGAKCGKSALAQELAVALSGSGKRYYIATMIPTGPEDLERIRRHVEDRRGLGFETVECAENILSVADPDGTFLVDSVTSLMQNALFPARKHYEIDPEGAEDCANALVTFAGSVRNAVFVSDYIYSDAETYSDSTESYRRCLASADRRLADISDVVIEVTAQQYIVHKGELCL